ncbi:MAG TPA: ABC transporter permease [Solirubrobacteraceae bacterium]
MSGLELLRVAWRALVRNKMRSFLTTLGIVIGVAAVIAMVAVGEGAKVRVQQTFAAMGTNLLIVLPGSTTSGGVHGGFGSASTLTWGDLKAIQTQVPTVAAAAPALRTTAQVVSDLANWTTSVQGTSPEYFQIRDWPAASGRLLVQSDVDSAAKVVVLGQTVVTQLFGAGADPVGQMVRIKNVPFEVVGVAARKGQSAFGTDYDDTVFIPVSTYGEQVLGGLRNYIAGIVMVSARTQDATARAQQQIEALLRDRHKLPPGVEDDFSIRNLSEIAAASEQGTQTITTLLAAVAGVSLVVGGIGIMNIMLVSVTERTREIGLRMAIGAKRRHILVQFLVEALSLASAGGFIGVVAGIAVAGLLAARFHWPMLLRPDVIVVAVVFSALTGVAFGMYPARKASHLDPIDALRYE